MLALASLLALGLLAGEARAPSVPRSEIEAAVRRSFPGAAIEARTLVFTAAERAARDAQAEPLPAELALWVARDARGVAGLAVAGDTPGKCQPITYLVITDAAARVRSVEILAYRESRGGEVREGSWRAQFVGKDASSELRLARDIRNVAGATISCRSVTDAVRRDVRALSLAAARVAQPQAGAPAPSAGTAGPEARAASVRCRWSMGTTLTIEARHADAELAARAVEQAFDEVAALEAQLSDWDPSSELARVEQLAPGEWHPLSEPLQAVLGRALEFWRSSGGAFDPGVGPLVRAWRAAAAQYREPSALEVAEARARPGCAELELGPAGWRCTRAGLALDLGGIGKGFALDRAAAVLDRSGVHCALLDFGGQLLALDAPPGTPGWRVDVLDPRDAGGRLETRWLARASLSTTADTQRGLVIGGKLHSHVIDPRTGQPVEGMLAAWVLHARATDADALSTALFVMGPERGLEWARAHGLDARILPAQGAPVCTGVFAASEGAR